MDFNILEQHDIVLKKAQMSDLEEIYNNFWKQEETAKFMLWETSKSLEEAKERLLRTIEYQKNNYAYFVYEKKSGRAMGFAGVKQIQENIFEESGIGIGPEFVGKGYGKQIVKALIDLVFNCLCGEKFIYTCFSQNIASKNLALSCGFKFVGTEEKVREKDGLKYISEIYELEK